MPETISISDKPTFDVCNFLIESVSEDGVVFVKSSQVFKFDKVFGNLENRSRVLRLNLPESELVEQIISASIDSGFCGHLVWKIKLTSLGYNIYKKENNLESFALKLKNCQQLHLFPSPAGNYYRSIFDENGNLVGGTNQTSLEPDIIFSL